MMQNRDEFSRQQEAYMDRESSRLAAGNLVDKWRAIAEIMEDVPRGRLLECGSGTGLYSRRFLDLGYEVWGVDLSEESIRSAGSHVQDGGGLPRYHAMCGDFREIVPHLEERFEVAVFIKVLHHFSDREAISEALSVAWEKLTPGGCLIGFEPDGGSPWWYLNFRIPDLLRGTDRWEFEKNTRWIRRRFLKSVFDGLSPVSIQFSKRYLLPGSLPGFDRLNLHRIDRWLSNLPVLRILAGNLLFKVRKPYG
jgi:SAM-dependent methyltransferase